MSDTDDLRAERDRLARELEEARAKYERLNAEAGRAYALVLQYEGSVQAVPLDELMRSRLERLREAEEHHQEHHAREEGGRG